MTSAGRIGKYIIEKVLGRGSMGVVYLARDPQIGRPVAVKTVALPRGLDEEKVQEYRERFLREARAAGRLSHPTIVTVYEADSGQWGGAPFIAMEYIAGEPWNLRARRGPAPNVDQVADMARQIASALDYAHRNGIVHRDIKPANIIETPDGRAKLMDFGIAKVPTSELTREGQFLGTPAYMSPEQILGKPADGRSDLFSLGCVLYEIITGKKPFPGEDIPSVTFKILNEDPEPMVTSNPEVPVELDAIIRHLLAKGPADRYDNAAQAVEDFDAYLAGGRPPHASHRVPERPERTQAQAAPAPPRPATAPKASGVPPPDSPPETQPEPKPSLSAPPPPAKKAHPEKARLARSGRPFLWSASAGVLIVLILAVAWVLIPAPPALDAPPAPGIPEMEAPRTPVHLLAEAPKPPPMVPKASEAPAAARPKNAAPEPAAPKIPAPCALDYTFTTGIVSGEYWIRLDGEVLEHRVIDRDFSMKGETYSGTFKVPPGMRTLQVQVKTNRQNVNSIGESKAEFPEGGTKSVKIIMTKFNKVIKFEWQ